jgi:hypothetical protein
VALGVDTDVWNYFNSLRFLILWSKEMKVLPSLEMSGTEHSVTSVGGEGGIECSATPMRWAEI